MASAAEIRYWRMSPTKAAALEGETETPTNPNFSLTVWRILSPIGSASAVYASSSV
jgi:hypothetical protein